MNGAQGGLTNALATIYSLNLMASLLLTTMLVMPDASMRVQMFENPQNTRIRDALTSTRQCF